jgi:hypothetical protein
MDVSQNSMEKLPNFNRINGKFESTIKITFILIDMKNLISLSTVKIILNISKNNFLHAIYSPEIYGTYADKHKTHMLGREGKPR